MDLTKAKACFSIMLYFKGASLRALLKKAMGCSYPWSFFYNKTPTIVCSKAKENKMKSLSNLGLISTGVLVKASFISLKDFLALTIHFIVEPFFIILFSDLINYARLYINLLRKNIFPKKACNSLMFPECIICKVTSILVGFILIPSFKIM